MTQTQPSLSPPPPSPPVATAAPWPDDELRELGDRIAGLTIDEARELSEYLAEKGLRE